MAVATNIRLPEEVLKALKYRAIEERKSVNRLVREAVERFLGIAPVAEPGGRDPFDAVVGMARSGIKEGSVRHDLYLYGKKK